MTSSAYVLASRLSVGALCMGMAAGCVNARDEYVDFGNRLVDADTRMIDGMIVSTLPDMNGEFYLAVRPNLPDEYIIKLIETFTYTPVTENTGRFDASGQPLDFDTDVPAGDLLLAEDVQVNNDASFALPVVGQLSGRANPVTEQEVAINLVLQGTIIDEDFLCGTLTGTAGALDLSGSTFGAVRITGGTLPPPVVRCEDAPSN